MMDKSHAASHSTIWRNFDCLRVNARPADNPEGEEGDDSITSISFDHAGEFLATGDQRGYVSIFVREHSPKKQGKHGSSASRSRGTFKNPVRAAVSWKSNRSKRSAPAGYRYFTEFRSHEGEFDYLKSLEIEEKINQIKWCRRSTDALMMLTTNDKTIKLWKVHEKKVRKVFSMNLSNGRRKGPAMRSSASLKIPTLVDMDPIVTASERRCYKNAHSYHVNSISVCSDGQHFISADDLRVNLWNLSRQQSFNILDIKPANMDDLTEVITAATYHPTKCNWFMYSSSCGKIKLADHRQSALCDNHFTCFYEEENPESKSFFSEIIASISDICFSPNGRQIVSRDYLRIKIWDIAKPDKPVQTININEHLRPKLCDLYENDCIFDKFQFSVNPNGDRFLTGSYHNGFQIYKKDGSVEASLKATPVPSEKGKTKAPKSMQRLTGFQQKILHTAWHPKENLIAVATGKEVMMFCR